MPPNKCIGLQFLQMFYVANIYAPRKTTVLLSFENSIWLKKWYWVLFWIFIISKCSLRSWFLHKKTSYSLISIRPAQRSCNYSCTYLQWPLGHNWKSRATQKDRERNSEVKSLPLLLTYASVTIAVFTDMACSHPVPRIYQM
jgi:hypothetical protein